MRTLHSIWKRHLIYFNWQTGQFATEKGFSSYVEAHVRQAAMNGF